MKIVLDQTSIGGVGVLCVPALW